MTELTRGPTRTQTHMPTKRTICRLRRLSFARPSDDLSAPAIIEVSLSSVIANSRDPPACDSCTGTYSWDPSILVLSARGQRPTT